MSPSRRDILKLAAGLGLTAAIPTSAERVAAIEILNTPLSSNPLLDPGTFAMDAESLIAGYNDEWWGALHPEQYAAYRQATGAYDQATSWLKEMPSVARLRNEMDTETFNMIMETYRAGLRQGAAFENLRRTVVGERTGCRTCWSAGITNDGDTCIECSGSGVVAMGGAK